VTTIYRVAWRRAGGTGETCDYDNRADAEAHVARLRREGYSKDQAFSYEVPMEVGA
jgi:hypothetical protein